MHTERVLSFHNAGLGEAKCVNKQSKQALLSLARLTPFADVPQPRNMTPHARKKKTVLSKKKRLCALLHAVGLADLED